MRLRTLRYFIVFAVMFTVAAKADVTQDDFVAKTTQNLLNLCTASPQDAHYREAIHFCQGYLVGAYHYYSAESAGKTEGQLVCFPDPKPSRNRAIEMFITWARNHPEFMNEMPVETEFRFLTETWPCKK